MKFAWFAAHSARLIQQCLSETGAILFRNFKVRNAAEFEQVVKAASASELLPYKERSSPRSKVEGNVYTSTDYPSDQSIFLHNENSRSEEHTSELQSQSNLVCRLLLEKKKK